MSRTLTSSCEESLSTGRRIQEGGDTRNFYSGLQILREMMGQISALELSAGSDKNVIHINRNNEMKDSLSSSG